jgi:WD40 repeat protein
MPIVRHRFWLACLFLAAIACAVRAEPEAKQLAYFGAWPHQVVVFDSAQEKIVDTIDLHNDVPRTLILSPDKKQLYVTTLNDNSIVTIDLATRKPISSFSLNTGNHNVRLLGLTPDPTRKYLFGIATVISKQIDHYDVDPPSFIVIDLAAQKIARTAEFPKGEGDFGFRTSLRVSPDGKLLYIFRENILVFDTSSFQLVRKIDLAKPQAPGIENVSLGLLDDPNALPGKVTSIFVSSDPYVHRAVFGIGVIDLSTLSVEFSPVGPVEAGDLMPLLLTPDRKIGYTVAITGDPGNRQCEFWAFDMKSRKRLRKREFDGRTRFNFGLSGDGTKILIYGAGFEIAVYDTQTFELRNTIETPGDMTTNLIVLPAASTAAASEQSPASPAR